MDDKKILVADDSEFMRKVLIGILEEAGYKNFTEASNGKEAIEQFNAEKPDLILLDYVMPESNGKDVLEAIGKEAKILMISAVGQEQVVEEAKALGALGYIVKPFDRKQVIDEINKVIA